MIGGGCPVKWSWISRKIADLRPRVDIKSGQVLVTFYARSDLGSQRIMRFKEIFESDSYVSTSTQVEVAHGGGGTYSKQPVRPEIICEYEAVAEN